MWCVILYTKRQSYPSKQQLQIMVACRFLFNISFCGIFFYLCCIISVWQTLWDLGMSWSMFIQHDHNKWWRITRTWTMRMRTLTKTRFTIVHPPPHIPYIFRWIWKWKEFHEIINIVLTIFLTQFSSMRISNNKKSQNARLLGSSLLIIYVEYLVKYKDLGKSQS